MNLLSADLRRFAARRLVRGTLAFALLLTLVIVGVQTARGHVYTSHEQQYVFNATDTKPTIELVPRLHDTRIDIAGNLSVVLAAVGVIMVCAAFVLGASFVGADYGGSSLSTQLLYEPRRWRVHASKAAAAAISCAAVTLCVLCTVALTMFLGSKLHGIAPDVDSEWWQHRAREMGRGVVGVGVAGAMAYAVTLAFRRTAVGAIAFLIQVPLAGALATNRGLLGAIGRSLPYYALQTFVLGRDHLIDPQTLRGVTTTAAAFALAAVWLVGLIAAAGAVFGRAEVR